MDSKRHCSSCSYCDMKGHLVEQCPEIKVCTSSTLSPCRNDNKQHPFSFKMPDFCESCNSNDYSAIQGSELRMCSQVTFPKKPQWAKVILEPKQQIWCSFCGGVGHFNFDCLEN